MLFFSLLLYIFICCSWITFAHWKLIKCSHWWPGWTVNGAEHWTQAIRFCAWHQVCQCFCVLLLRNIEFTVRRSPFSYCISKIICFDNEPLFRMLNNSCIDNRQWKLNNGQFGVVFQKRKNLVETLRDLGVLILSFSFWQISKEIIIIIESKAICLVSARYSVCLLHNWHELWNVFVLVFEDCRLKIKLPVPTDAVSDLLSSDKSFQGLQYWLLSFNYRMTSDTFTLHFSLYNFFSSSKIWEACV